MRNAPPEALTVDVRPIMTAHLAARDLRRLFPLSFADVDPLAAPEPSKAALLRLEGGDLVLLEYGLVTSTLTVSVPVGSDFGATLIDLLTEARISDGSIEWISEDVLEGAIDRISVGAEQLGVMARRAHHHGDASSRRIAVELRRTFENKKKKGNSSQTKLPMPRKR